MSLFGTHASPAQGVTPMVQTAYAPPEPRAAATPSAPREPVSRPPVAQPGNQYAPSAPESGARGDQAFSADAGDQAESDFSFWDFLDIINPLQHIPVVNTVYREITGDEISTASRMIGGTLFGGPIGFASALANELVRDESGKDIGEHVYAMVTGDDEAEQIPTSPSATAVAENDLSDDQIRTAGEVFPQMAMAAQGSTTQGPSGIPNAPPPRPGQPNGQPNYTAAPAQMVERAPLPPTAQQQTQDTAQREQQAQQQVPIDDPRMRPRGPLFSTDRGFSPYNRPAGTAAEMAPTPEPMAATPPPQAAAPRAMSPQGINAQTSHPMLDLGPSATPNGAVGRVGGPRPKIVTELQKPPVMPQGLMGGAGAMPGLPGSTGGSSGLSALTAGAGGIPGAPNPAGAMTGPATVDMGGLQQSWSQATPGLKSATPTPVAFEKAMFTALNKYEQMRADDGQGDNRNDPANQTQAVR